MRTMAIALVAGAMVRLLAVQPAPILTVAQQDALRSNPDAASGDVSADGRYVAFTSYVRLAAADTNDRRDVYVLDLADGRVTLESVGASGRVSTADSDHPRISADGRMLVYETIVGSAPRQVIRSDIVLRDRREGTSRIVSDAPGGAPGNGWARSPAINADGTRVVFASTATNLENPDSNGDGDDVYIFDARRGGVHRVSVDDAGRQRSFGVSSAPSISGDGRYVAFTSTADLSSSGERMNSRPRVRPSSSVYVRDTWANRTRLVSTASGLQSPDGSSWGAAISADGAVVAFVSYATNLVASDRNRSSDVFVWNAQTAAIELVSRSIRGGAANGPSGSPAVSADGRFLLFQSEASDLLCAQRCTAATEDINLLPDVFLLDRHTGAVARVSGDDSGAWMEPSGGPALDSAASVLVFSSRHPMNADDTRNDFDLFVCRAQPPSMRSARR